MDTMKVTCGTCAGIGKHYNWKIVSTEDAFGTMEREEVVCKACNGIGYTEYATFTLEEAKAILKHCGLSSECSASKPEYVNKNKEAEWVYDHWCEFKCSNCGNWSNSKPYKGREKYCPECGAKMKNT